MDISITDRLKALTALLAREYNCSPEDFLRPETENVLTVSALKRGRRMYSKKKYFFHMCTLGGNAVITADERLHPFLSEFMREKAGYWLFEMSNLHPLEAELNRFGHTLTDSYHMFLPRERVDSEQLQDNLIIKMYGKEIISLATEDMIARLRSGSRDPEPDFIEYTNAFLQNHAKSGALIDLKWFSDSDILPFYGHPLLKNAILKEFAPERPDRILLCAYIGDELIGAAGCSEDARDWMQIGVDVAESYRSKGLGSLLVNMLKNELEDRFLIPFYGTSVSNYRSWNIALNCGFRPAWVEIGSTRRGGS